MKFLRYGFLAIVAYIAFCVVLLISASVWSSSNTFLRIVNLWAKPDLFVWASSKDSFYQDVEINEMPLVKGEFFNSNTEPSVDEGEYYLVLLNGRKDLPPQSIRTLLDISDNSIEEALNGKNIKITVISSGFRLSWIPIFVRSRTVVLADISGFDVLYDGSCHRDIIYEMLVSFDKYLNVIKNCKL
ncbi:hypothetical protein [Parasedimentitalea maritima]|uniref:Uncharacterized protein n=1 Tax=Parasedimentitalea maritima TaxID=2578117 RepID=A0A6A4RNM6_9RHOB|nr:hypothetical protein [Zongyanglinia marina]KAE9631749.1 hypothetical protein GP644_05440 [Zongyanglinia marina]